MNPVIRFYEEVLRLPNGPCAGDPFVLLDWQRELLEAIYKDQASPQVREVFVSMPKKNAKTSWAAGVLLYQLIAEPNERKAEIYSAACSEAQAKLIWEAAASMVTFSPQLTELVEQGKLEVYRDNMIYHAKSGDRIYRALASEATNIHGINPSIVLIDEVHGLRGNKGRELVDALTKSTITRRSPLTIYLTHAGSDLNCVAADIEKRIDRFERGVLKQPDSFIYRIHRAPPNVEWDSEEAWAIANPAYRTLIPREAYLEAVETARQTPNLQRSYRTYHLNQWTESSESIVNLEDWKACKREYSEEDLYGRPAFAGFDSSIYDDLTAFMLVFPPVEEDEEQGYRTLTHAFIPEERLREKELRDQVPYWEWHEKGYLHLTPGAVIDEDFVIQTILAANEKFDIREMAYDPHRARHIVKKLDEAGVTTVEHRTGSISMAEPTAQFIKHVIAHTLHHDGNPLLAWNVGNVQGRIDVSGNLTPKKGKNIDKIDCAFALILALGRAVAGNDTKPFVSAYAAGEGTYGSIYAAPIEAASEGE